MDGKLMIQATTKVTLGVLLMMLVLFLPAGTTAYPGAWLLMGVLFVPMVIAGFVMMAKAPALLRKRLNMKETQAEQKQVIAMSLLMFVGGFALAGLDFRFGWSRLPFGVSLAAAAVFLLGYALYAEVLRENAYLSRTVEIQADQKLVDTGLYGVVRHPMYMATLLLFLAMPLILGSLPAFVVFLAYLPIIVKRIENEEQVLLQGLEGYAAYREKVRWRLIPLIW